MKTLIQFLFVWALLTAGLLMGCEEEDDDKLNKAQACLDDARVAADAAACKSIVGGMTSPKAMRIRCALEMLGNNLTQSAIIDSFEVVNSGTTTASPMLEMSSSLASNLNGASTDADVVLAQDILNICEETNSPGLIAIANSIYLGAITRDAAFDGGGDPNSIVDVVANLGAVDATQLGTIANSIYGSYCTATTDSEICNCLRENGAGSLSLVVIGGNLQTDLAQNTCQ